MKSIILSSVLLASAQLSNIPRRQMRLRRGGDAVRMESEIESAAEKEFGRARELEQLSLSISISMSLDLEPAGMFEDEMSSPTHVPSYVPTSPPSYWPTCKFSVRQ